MGLGTGINNARLTRSHRVQEFLTQRGDKECISRTEEVAKTGFKRITYTDAVALLEQHLKEGKVTFEVRGGFNPPYPLTAPANSDPLSRTLSSGAATSARRWRSTCAA